MRTKIPRPVPWILVAAIALCCSCASWWARTPEHIVDVGKILSCVMAEYDAGTKVLDVVVKCGLKNEQEVIDLVTAQKTAEARHAKAGVVAGCQSASATPSSSASSSSPPVPSASASAKPSSSASAKPAASGSAK